MTATYILNQLPPTGYSKPDALTEAEQEIINGFKQMSDCKAEFLNSKTHIGGLAINIFDDNIADHTSKLIPVTQLLELYGQRRPTDPPGQYSSFYLVDSGCLIYACTDIHDVFLQIGSDSKKFNTSRIQSVRPSIV